MASAAHKGERWVGDIGGDDDGVGVAGEAAFGNDSGVEDGDDAEDIVLPVVDTTSTRIFSDEKPVDDAACCVIGVGVRDGDDVDDDVDGAVTAVLTNSGAAGEDINMVDGETVGAVVATSSL